MSNSQNSAQEEHQASLVAEKITS